NGEQGGQGRVEEENDGPFKYGMQFNQRTIRQAFIRKVFFLVTIMLGVMATMTALPFFFPQIKQNFLRGGNVAWFYGAYGLFFATYMVLICCESVRRSFPMNIILTAVFTVATGFMTMCLSMQFSTESVLIALITVTVCCAIIIIFSIQTKYDLTSCMGVLAILGMFLFVFGIVAMIGTMFFHARILHTIYAGVAALLFMAYLAVDVQLLMGGRKYAISPEDHIFAAVQLFTDILQIFWMILQLFGSR
ncbi:hypothetical protein PMAYCL1PPCAC_15346, partial [Pristionchus mayeri]